MKQAALVRGLTLLALMWPSSAAAQLVIAPGEGCPPQVHLIEGISTRTFDAYDPRFLGGVSVAMGDVNGDGVADVITGAGASGSPHVEVFSGTDLSVLASFYAYNPVFTGGVHVAAGDINGDGFADIITGPGYGGSPHVVAFSGRDLSVLASFYAYDTRFHGGVRVAAGDVNGDGFADIVAGAGPTGSPHVVAFSGPDLSVLASFYAYNPAFVGGVHVTAGDFNGDGRAEIVTAPDAGGSPHVIIFTGSGSALGGFYAFDERFLGGVNLATGDLNSDGWVDLIMGSGQGAAAPVLRVLSGVDGSELSIALPPGVNCGVGVGSVGDGASLRVTSAATTSFTVGAAATFTVTTIGSPVPVLTAGGAIPAGLTFTDNGNGTATLGGTPDAGTGGSYPLMITADNGLATETQDFTLLVMQPPAVTSAAATTLTIGVPGTFTVTTTGFPAPTLSVGGTLPDGVTFVDNGNGTGTLSGTPPVTSAGTYALAFTATNGVGSPVVQSFTLTVNGAPTFTSAAATTFALGVAGSFTVTAVGSPTPTLSVGALPGGIVFVDNLNGTGTLSGTPAAGTAGAHTITFTATNGVGGPVTQTFTLSITEGPVITSASSVNFAIGAANSFTVTTGGFPAPSLVQGGALPSGVTWVDNGNGTGTLSGTPAAGTGGSYALTFTATNGSGSAVQNFTLTVSGSPGFTSAATTTFTVGSAGTFTVTAVGAPAPALTVSGTLPSGVTFVDNGNGTGTLSGTPAAGTGGVYALTFTAANGVLPDGTQAFALNVNEAPAIASAASTTFTAGTPGTFTVTTSGLPLPAIAIGGVALPSGVTFVDNGNGTGTLSGTPAAGTGGTYAISFTATNTVGASAPQAFTLTVNQAPVITSANTVDFTVGVPGTFTVTTTGFPAPAISRTGAALPSGVTFVDNGNGTGTLSGTPAAGTAGAYAFTLTATNSTSPAGLQTFTLNVSQPPAITSATSTTFTVGAPGTFTVTTTGFPTPTVSQTGTLPTGVTFTPATRVLAGTPTQTGAFPLVFTATNGFPPDATQNFTLNVACPVINVTPTSLPEGLYLTAYSPVDFNQTGSTGSTFTWGATGLVAGLSIDANTGVVSGTPTNTVAGALVAITVTDNFGCTGAVNTTLTVRPVADNDTYNNGVGNTQFVVGAAVPTTPNVFVNEHVKMGDAGPGALSVTFPATSTNGGTIVEGAGDGTFTYTPAVAFAGPTDTFTYTLTDGNGVTNTGTVTINLSNVVWYVNSAAGAGDGRSHNPFNTLSAAATPSGSTHIIYVHSGGASTTGNLALDANQTLHGQGATFNLNALTIASGARPTLTGTVTLANNSAVTAANFTPSGIPAMTASALTQPVTIDQVNVTGGTSALSLTNVSGAVTVTNTNFTNTSAAEVLISGGTSNVTIGATISSNAGRSIDIQNRTGGIVTFTGAITDTGQGVFLNANTGSTINFTGGLALTTTTNPGFTATGGGTVSATQNNTTIVNTIATTTGTALNVANTTIGASGLTFRSIAANGATNGIVLNATGAGALTVTGNSAGNCGGTVTVNAVGTPATVGAPDVADCTGGTIQATTGAGISLTNTTGTSLTRMRILNSGTDSILANSVNGFTLARSYITDGSGVAGDRGIEMGDFSTGTPVNGTITVSNSTIGPTPHDNFGIGIASGTSAWSITNSVFTGSAGNSGLNFEIRNATVSNFLINGSVFQNQFADGMQMQPASNVSANLTATIQNSTFTGNNLHMDLNHDGTGSTTYSVLNNTFRTAQSHAFNLFSSAVQAPATGGTLDATITGNVVGTAGTASSGSVLGNGLRININGGVDATVLVDSNTIRQTPNGRGIEVISRNGTAGLDITATNNVFNNDFITTPENGGFSLASAFFQSNCVTVCNTLRADIRSNTVPAAAPNGELLAAQLAVIETSTSTFQLVDTGAASASCTAQLTENNTGSASANAGCSLIPGPISTP